MARLSINISIVILGFLALLVYQFDAVHKDMARAVEHSDVDFLKRSPFASQSVSQWLSCTKQHSEALNEQCFTNADVISFEESRINALKSVSAAWPLSLLMRAKPNSQKKSVL